VTLSRPQPPETPAPEGPTPTPEGPPQKAPRFIDDERPTPSPTPDDTPAPINNPFANPDDSGRPTGEVGIPDPRDQPSPTDSSGGELYVPTDAVTSEEVVAGGAAAGAGIAAGAAAANRARGGAGGGAFLRGVSGGAATRRAAAIREVPTASDTESINASRPANVNIDTTVESAGINERDLERALEEAKREAKREVKAELRRAFR